MCDPNLILCSLGEWHVILQTDKINQRVAIDMCHHPNKACPGVSDCGKKSRCVQRYNYQVGKNQKMRLNNSINFSYDFSYCSPSPPATPAPPCVRPSGPSSSPPAVFAMQRLKVNKI